MRRVKAFVIRILQAMVVWMAGPAEAVVLEAPRYEREIAELGAKLERMAPTTALVAKAREYVRLIEAVHSDKGGEFKRHQVYAMLLKDFPPMRKGDKVKLSRAIDDAVEVL